MKNPITAADLETEFLKFISLLSPKEFNRPGIQKAIDEIRQRIEQIKPRTENKSGSLPYRIPVTWYH